MRLEAQGITWVQKPGGNVFMPARGLAEASKCEQLRLAQVVHWHYVCTT